MLNIETIFFYIFCWSVLVILRSIFITTNGIFSKEPRPIKMSKTELILISLTLSYIITYLTR